MNDTFQLMAIDDSASSLGTLAFGGWVSMSDAVKTMREEFPTAIAVLAPSNWGVVWQDKHALASLS